MLKSKEVVCYPAAGDQSRPNIYSLPGRRKPINDNHLYGHEMDCADAFVAARMAAGESLVRWERFIDLEKPLKAVYLKYGYRPDRIFEHSDISEIFHLEHDRGTEEDLDKYIRAKCEAFIKMSDAFDSQNMTMLFTVRGYRYHRDANHRANDLHEVVSSYKRGNQILIALFDKFLLNPFGNIWVNSKGLHIPLTDAFNATPNG